MANRKAAVKRIKTSEKKRVANSSIKSKVKTEISKVRKLVETNQEEAQKLLPTAISAIDKACKKGILHKNTASRKKSRLLHAINSAAKK